MDSKTVNQMLVKVFTFDVFECVHDEDMEVLLKMIEAL
jgi:hypothetical protein